MSFRISPGTRYALIFTTFFFGLLGMSSFWIYREARRVQAQRKAMRSVNAANGTGAGEMVWINGGSFNMGGIGEEARPDELPLHDVKVDAFLLDRTPVTNAQFEQFVNATKYVTAAERPTGASAQFLQKAGLDAGGVSWCFVGAPSLWSLTAGATWRHPEGARSDLQGREKHPVVHVSFTDAMAYCRWAGKRLPTEAEWEYAARGGVNAQVYTWGNELRPGGKWVANLWQGPFPDQNSEEDGFKGTSPVGSFPANGYGLHDIAGNVWQWTADWYRPETYATLAKNPDWGARRNPQGPENSADPEEPGAWKKVIRGGSFLSPVTPGSGQDFRPSARGKLKVETTRDDVGFRCAKDAPAGTPVTGGRGL